MSERKNIQNNWHPNFRIESTLPDTRVVRIHVISKIVLYAVILIVAVVILQREYQSYLLRQTINRLEQQIQSASSADKSRLEKSNQFRELALNVKELQRFFRTPLMVHDSVVALARMKPKELTFTRLDLSELVVQAKVGPKSQPKVVFELNISGNVKDLPILTQFKRKLEESELLNLSSYTVIINEDIEQRNTDTEIVPFRLSILLETAKDKSITKE